MKQDLRRKRRMLTWQISLRRSREGVTTVLRLQLMEIQANGKNDYQRKVMASKHLLRPSECLHKSLGEALRRFNQCGGIELSSQTEDKIVTKRPFEKYSDKKLIVTLGYNLNLPDYYYDDEWTDSDRVKDSLTSRLVSKTSAETPLTSENQMYLPDNHGLIPCAEVKWISKYRKDNTESQGIFRSVRATRSSYGCKVTIPNCYKQAIRSRDASKWHDAMDKEINVMKERKVWDLVDHPDNIKILENRWALYH
ncbi:gag_pre-integrs domain-containing protein [Trichonephila clavipes]|nr:gag_pre-integrs domain-containing protein [Trichonephila clavipes]